MMNCYEILKNNLKVLRVDAHLTQEQAADKAGIPRANLGRYETGENVPPLDVLIKLADFYEITLDELLRTKIK